MRERKRPRVPRIGALQASNPRPSRAAPAFPPAQPGRAGRAFPAPSCLGHWPCTEDPEPSKECTLLATAYKSRCSRELGSGLQEGRVPYLAHWHVRSAKKRSFARGPRPRERRPDLQLSISPREGPWAGVGSSESRRRPGRAPAPGPRPGPWPGGPAARPAPLLEAAAPRLRNMRLRLGRGPPRAIPPALPGRVCGRPRRPTPSSGGGRSDGARQGRLGWTSPKAKLRCGPAHLGLTHCGDEPERGQNTSPPARVILATSTLPRRMSCLI
jgi:hypothetical protein